MVAEDPALADAIARLAGEWSELSGGEMVVSRAAGTPLDGDDFPQGDLLVFPSRLLGALAEEGRLRPVRSSALSSPTLAYEDLYPSIRQRVLVYGQRVMALPIGCPVPLMITDATNEPAAWSDLAAMAPIGIGMADDSAPRFAYLLLARAGCYALHPARQAVLFDPRSMTPRLAEPSFVRALKETVEQTTLPGSGDASPAPPPSTAVLWPLRGGAAAPPEASRHAAQAQDVARFVRLPGAKQVYSPVSGEWEAVEGAPQRVTLLASGGRLLAVTARSRNATAAFRLAAWLAGPSNAPQLSRASPGTANSRLSLAGVGDDWVGAGSPPLSRQAARAHRESLQAGRSLVVPRILRVDDYLGVLDAAVRRAARQEVSAEAALRQAAADWEDLTEAVGRDRQRRAYLRHLGIEPFDPATR